MVIRRRHHLRVHFWIGLAILLLFSGLKLGLGRTEYGHWLHVQAYYWLHSHVARSGRVGEKLPVVVVDISDLKPVPVAGPDPQARLEFTPRDELTRLVHNLTEGPLPASPAAIGLDIDLSPETNGFVAPGSFDFFDVCLRASERGIPVVLGVRRMEAFGPEAWLGHAKYAPLAASTSRPKGMVTQMTYEYEFGSGARPLRSLSHALAHAFRARHGEAAGNRRRLLGLLTHEISVEVPIPTIEEFKVRQFYVDFSSLKALQSSGIPRMEILTNLPGKLADRISGKIVLIGDASRAEDMAMVPGEPEPVPGVFVQACATRTLVEARLLELRWWVGLGLSIILSLAALGAVHGACWKYSQRSDVTPIPLNLILTLVVVVLLLVSSVELVRRVRVMWLEVFAVCLVVFTHCALEIFFASVHWKSLKGGLSNVGEALLKSPHPEEGTN